MEKENKYYVYAYLDPRKPGKYSYSGLNFSFLYEPFYIGKGKNDRDIQHLIEYKYPSTKKRNLYKNNKIHSILKDRFDPIIIRIKEKLLEYESLDLEVFLINSIGRHDLEKGPLTNHTNGGESIKGYIFTDEVKSKMSEIQKNNINHSTRGKSFSDEHKNKIRQTKIGNKNPMFGKKSIRKDKTLEEIYGEEKSSQIKLKLKMSHIGHLTSEETRNKMSLSRIGKKLNGNFKGQPKSFKFINPDNIEFIVIGNFDKFCKENNLPTHTFKRIVQNNRKNKFYNGWTVVKI